MILRHEIEPLFEIAQKRYPKILELITRYEDYVDENGDEDNSEYKRIQGLIQEIAQKDVSGYSLYETWEAEGPEILAFRISLPDPGKLENISEEELKEVIHRIKKCEYLDEENDNDFALEFSGCLDNYYHKFLAVNYPKKYKYALFIRQKDGSFLTEKQIIEKLL